MKIAVIFVWVQKSIIFTHLSKLCEDSARSNVVGESTRVIRELLNAVNFKSNFRSDKLGLQVASVHNAEYQGENKPETLQNVAN